MYSHSFDNGHSCSSWFALVWIPPMSTDIGCIAARGTVAQTCSALPLEGQQAHNSPWHWGNPKRSSSIWLEADIPHVNWLLSYGWALLLGCTREAYSCRKSHPTCSQHATLLVADDCWAGDVWCANRASKDQQHQKTLTCPRVYYERSHNWPDPTRSAPTFCSCIS